VEEYDLSRIIRKGSLFILLPKLADNGAFKSKVNWGDRFEADPTVFILFDD